MITATKPAIQRAVRDWNRGNLPWSLRAARSWYLVDQGKRYPLKNLFALAIGRPPKDFQTSDAIRECRRHGYLLVWDPAGDTAFAIAVANAAGDSRAARQQRLAVARKRPIRKTVQIEYFVRNPDVVAERLDIARGKCEGCGKHAPFVSKVTGLPYLEVHHKQRLTADGLDVVDNTIALCPNCHRKAHYG